MTDAPRASLRQIVDAFATIRPDFSEPEAIAKLYDRARMLRDRGLIQTSSPAKQGRTTTYSEADTVAAVVALTASLNGQPWGVIEAINLDLRLIGNTQGHAAFEEHLDAIKANDPVFIRLDFIFDLLPYTKARMNVGFDRTIDPLDPRTTQFLVFPVTAIAKPILDLIFPQG